MSRDLAPCFGCDAELSPSHLASLELELDDGDRAVALCVRCIWEQAERIKDTAEAMQWIAELTLVAAAEPDEDASAGDLALHDAIAVELQDPVARGDYISTVIEASEAQAAQRGPEAAARAKAISELKWLLRTWEKRRQAQLGDPATLRITDATISSIRVQLRRVVG